MKEFRVTWQQYPFNYHEAHVLFIEAGSADDAKLIARDHVQRRLGLAGSEFQVRQVEEAAPPPAGRVLG